MHHPGLVGSRGVAPQVGRRREVRERRDGDGGIVPEPAVPRKIERDEDPGQPTNRRAGAEGVLIRHRSAGQFLRLPIERVEIPVQTLQRRSGAAEIERPAGLVLVALEGLAELLGEVAQYESTYRLCYLRGPAGIIVALAEQIG